MLLVFDTVSLFRGICDEESESYIFSKNTNNKNSKYLKASFLIAQALGSVFYIRVAVNLILLRALGESQSYFFFRDPAPDLNSLDRWCLWLSISLF